MSIRIEQSSTYVGDNRWNWAIWLTGPAEELDRIDHVIYTLDPTFPNPVRKIHARTGGFRLKSNGWGEFTIYLDIVYKDGGHQQLSHDLQLAPRTSTAEKEDSGRGAGSGGEPASSAEQTMPAVQRTVTELADKLIAAVETQRQNATIFVSGGVADAEIVRRLREDLKKLNVHVLETEDASASVPYQVYVSNLIAKADLVVFLLSGRPSLWLSQEIEYATQQQKRIVPILVGEDSQLPDALQGNKSFRLDNLGDIESLARMILSI